jgi:universal stress protein A
MPLFRRILCPVDFDQNSPMALRFACDLAREERNATLDVLHVVAIPPGPEVAIPFDKLEGKAKARLQRMVRQKIDGKVPYQLHIRTGDPGTEVIRTAEQIGADLIIMVTHGRRGLGRFLLGSVAEKVAREAPCPVLTIRPGVIRARRSAAKPRRTS